MVARYLRSRDVDAIRALGRPVSEQWAEHERLVHVAGDVDRPDSTRETRPERPVYSLLHLKRDLARQLLSPCTLCELRCGALRSEGEAGVCGVSDQAFIAMEFMHFGEEEEISPAHAVYLSGCNWRCAYCHEWRLFAEPTRGYRLAPDFADVVRRRKVEGARSLEFVGGSPEPHLAEILDLLTVLDQDLPIVWNSQGYLTGQAMRLLDGVVDVHVLDFKYGNDDCARRLSGVPDHTAVVLRNARAALSQGSVILRHLVLPGHLECCTRPVIEFAARLLPRATFHLMGQYRPAYRTTRTDGPLAGRLSESEWAEAQQLLSMAGLRSVIMS